MECAELKSTIEAMEHQQQLLRLQASAGSFTTPRRPLGRSVLNLGNKQGQENADADKEIMCLNCAVCSSDPSPSSTTMNYDTEINPGDDNRKDGIIPSVSKYSFEDMVA